MPRNICLMAPSGVFGKVNTEWGVYDIDRYGEVIVDARAASDLLEAGFLPAGRKPIALGIFGQSVELGSVLLSDQPNYPGAFQSQRNPAVTSPSGPSSGAGGRGGFWPAVYDEMWGWGYDLRMVNGALGSMSFTKDAAGQVQYRQNNGAYRAQRQSGATGSGNSGDRGYYGDVLVANGRVFVCTTGRAVAAFSDGPFRVNGGQTNLDYIETVGTQAAAGSAPDFSTATVGSTVTDGTVVWTCVSTDAAGLGITNGTIFTEAQKGFGFDPFGAMARLHEEMQRTSRNCYRKIIYIQNGQSDTSATAAWYRDALSAIASYFLARNYEVMIGLTTWYPRSTVTAYNNLTQGRADALTVLRAVAANAGRVWDGPNLYQLMGTTGPMGGWRGTATITSGVMTVASTVGGAGIEPGQTLTDANNNVIGSVTSLGTYTPGAGTGTVNVVAADKTSNTFQTVGSWIYPSDATHLNGRGNIGPSENGVDPIYKHVSDALKLALPNRPV